VRSDRAEAQLPPLPTQGSRIARIRYDDAAELAKLFADADAIVHLPGVLIETAGSTYEIANVAPIRAVTAAAVRAGTRKLVLVSAIGADASSSNRYYQTKGEAEQIVRESGLDWTVLRAPLVLGPGTEGAAALRRDSAGSVARLIGGGRQVQRPLDVDDLARATLRACERDVASRLTLDLVGPEALRQCDLVARAGRARGREVGVRSLPTGLLRALLKLRGRVSGPGFSVDALEVILDDDDVDPAPATRALGIELTPLAQTIERSLENT